jgi:hypothetical protein
MHHTYNIFPEHRLHIEQIEGEFTLGGLATATDKMLADPSFDPSFDSVVDFRNAEAQMTRVEILAYSELMKTSDLFNGQSKWVIVASDPLILELSEIFRNQINQNDSIQVVTTIQAAAEFINCPEVLNYLQDE